MSTALPIRFGSNTALAAPAFDDLYLPIFGGEVLKRYNEFLGITSKMKRRDIRTGNTARFPRLGGMTAERHAVGTKLLGLDAEQTEVTITLDERPLVSHFRLDDIDQAMSHFEVRSEYAMQAAQALAEAQDQFSLRLAINASRETPTTVYGGSGSNFPGGGLDGNGTAATDALWAAGAEPTTAQVMEFLVLLDSIAIRFDRLRVLKPNRWVAVDVPAFHRIRDLGFPKSTGDLDNAFLPVFSGDGRHGPTTTQSVLAPGDTFASTIAYNGFVIFPSNICASVFGQDLSSDDEVKYQGDFTQTRAMVWQEEAVGIAIKMDVNSEAERDISRQDFLFVSKMLSGGGTIRPEAAVEIVAE